MHIHDIVIRTYGYKADIHCKQIINFFLSCFSVLLLILVGSAQAHSVRQAPKNQAAYDAIADGLTKQLLSAHSARKQSNLLQAPQGLATIAKARHDHFKRIIKTNPSEVIRLALPSETRSSLPENIRPYIEENVSVEGSLEVWHFDMKKSEESYFTHTLHTASESINLNFPNDLPNMQTDTKIRATGIKLNNEMAIGSASSNVNLLALPDPKDSLGARTTLVMMVNFFDKVEKPWTKAEAEKLFFDTTNKYDKETSYGQTWLTGTVTDWLTVDRHHDRACDSDGDRPDMNTLARQAATAAGYIISDYHHLVYVFPPSNCQFWGGASVGGSPSVANIQGSLALQVIAHEMGHNFGLLHANFLDCDTQSLGDTCTHGEYGDRFDVMGGSASGHFNAFHKDALGWLNTSKTPSITTITSGNAQYNIDALSTPNSGVPKALKIARTNTSLKNPEWFYVELRRPLGFDSYISSNSNVMNGILIHRAIPDSMQSHLLDMTPSPGDSWNDPALTVGQQFKDPLTGITIKLNAINGNTANVSVAYPGSDGTSQVQINASAGANGSISPTGDVMVNKGSSQTFNITPAAGYATATVTVDGVNKGAIPTFTFSDVQSAHTISATFKPNALVIAAQAGANGSISPSGNVPVTKGSNKTFTITPAAGYEVASLSVDGASVKVGPSYTFNNIQNAHTIRASFQALQQPDDDDEGAGGLGGNWLVGLALAIIYAARSSRAQRGMT